MVGGVDIGWQVVYDPPVSVTEATSVSLVQTGGKQVRVEGETTGGEGSDVTAPRTMSTKVFTDSSAPPPLRLYTPRPSTMFAEFEQPFTVEVQWHDLAGNLVGRTGPCGDEPYVNAQGGGCSLVKWYHADPRTRDDGGNRLIVMTLLSLPFLLRNRPAQDKRP